MITIFTTPLAKKIIEKEFGEPKQKTNIIMLSRESRLFDEMRYNRILKKTTIFEKRFTEKIIFQTDSKLVHTVITTDLLAIGLRLDNYAKRKLETTVLAQSELIGKKNALRNFYEKYDLSEWDYPQEAALKLVQRAEQRVEKKVERKKNKKNTDFFQRFTPSAVPPKVEKKANANYTLDELEKIAMQYQKRYAIYFQSVRGNSLTKLPIQLRAWVLAKIGDYNTSEIAETLKLSQYSVRYCVTKFEEFLKQKNLEFPAPELTHA